MIAKLLEAKLRTARGAMRSNQEGRHRAPTFILLSVVFAAVLFRSARWIVLRSLEIQPVGELLVQKLIAITLLIFFGLLLFSNFVTAFSTFYLADDLDFLMAHPIKRDDLFIARFLESLTQSSWVVTLFGVPAFVGAGVGIQAGWGYYLALVVLFLPFAAIPTGLATIASLLVTNMLAADRMRDALLFFGAAIFVVFFAVVRAFKIEQLLNPESFDSVGEVMVLLSPPEVSVLPSDWLVGVLSPLLFNYGQIDRMSLVLLMMTPLALFFISAWLHRALYVRGYSRVQEGRHGGSVLVTLRDWLLRRSVSRTGDIQHKIAKIGARRGDMSPLRQLMIKDLTIFTRDASQWSNLLVVAAMMIIYLVNYKYFQGVSGTNLVGQVGLYYFNLAVCGFVVVALSGRFLFPAISVEGRSFWVMLQAPISLERLLASKWLGAIFPVMLVGQATVWASNLLVGEGLVMMLLASGFMVLNTLAVAAMAVGMGAIYPQFHNPNAASISASFGAIIFMMVSIGVVMTDLLVLFFPILYIQRLLMGMTPEPYPVFYGLMTLLGVIIPAAAAYISLRAGARSLRRRL